MYGSGVIESVLRYIEGYQPQSILALSFVGLVIFVIVVSTFIGHRRLGRRVDELARILNGLVHEREVRYTRELLGRAKTKDPG